VQVAYCPNDIIPKSTTSPDRRGHDPVTLLRNYAKRTRKAGASAASIIGNISKGILGN
jgi:hypothetical protein